jgi:DNA-binding NarL/FixJ family response regulator
MGTMVMRILIGDDHLLFREGLRRLLEQLHPDAQFVEAGSFGELVEQSAGSERFDVVMMDLHMPGWPGFAGIAEVQANQPGVPLVVVSASEALSDIRGALDRGASGYIPKSSSVNVMMSALNLILSGGIYVPPAALAGSLGDMRTRRGFDPIAERAGNHGLTQRQREVLDCLRAGKSNKQIAYELGLSEGTVKIHVTAIFKSLGVKNRTQAVIAASAFAS